MKATPKALLRRLSGKHAPMIEEAITGTPTVPAIAESAPYLLAWTMIDKGQGGTQGMPASMRRRALDAMIRLSETEPKTLAGMLAEAGALGLSESRSLAMTLVTLQNTHLKGVGAQ